MKKQSQYAIFLLAVGAIAIIVLAIGLVGLQKLTSMSRADQAKYEAMRTQCTAIAEALAGKTDQEKLLASLDMKLNSIDTNLVNYEYIPTYLEQLQRTAKQTGNEIASIRPRPIEPLDINNPLLKASHDAWQKEHPPLQPIEEGNKPAVPKATKPDAKAEKPASNYRLQQYSLEISGSYLSLMKLLSALSAFPKLVYVRTIALSPASRTDPNRLTVRLETYAIIIPEHYQPEKNPAITTTESAQPVTAAQGGSAATKQRNMSAAAGNQGSVVQGGYAATKPQNMDAAAGNRGSVEKGVAP